MKNNNPIIPAKSKCCNAPVKAAYKKLIPGTTLISKNVDYFYCAQCNKKVTQADFMPGVS